LPEDTTTLTDKLTWEKELLGIYVSGHPTDQFVEGLKKYRGSIRAALKEEREGYPVVIGGVIDQAKTILTKNGGRMSFLTVTDRDGAIETVIFPKLFQEKKDLFTAGKPVVIKGKISNRNGQRSVVADAARGL
jgi:DNA polymerase-3 subunit alpha